MSGAAPPTGDSGGEYEAGANFSDTSNLPDVLLCMVTEGGLEVGVVGMELLRLLLLMEIFPFGSGLGGVPTRIGARGIFGGVDGFAVLVGEPVVL